MTYLLFFLGSFVIRLSLLMTSSQSQAVFGSVFVFPSRVALGSIFALILMSFPFLFRVPFAVSAYFGVLSNFLTRFSRLPLRLLLLVFLVARSLSSYFHSKLSLHKLEL